MTDEIKPEYQDKKPDVEFQNTDIYVKRSRDASGVTLTLGGIKYKVLSSEFEAVMKEVCDELALYTMVIQNGEIKLTESELKFVISNTGLSFLTKYEGETYTITVKVLQDIMTGQRKGAFLVKMVKLDATKQTAADKAETKKSKNKKG